MSTEIDEYKAAKIAARKSSEWAGLIGKKYHGGGGGLGHLRSLSLASGEASPTIYHQYSNGSQNYHPMPVELKPYLEAAIKQNFSELLALALSSQSEALKELAGKAVKEHEALLQAAGLFAEMNAEAE